MDHDEVAELRTKAKELGDSLYPTIGKFAISFEANCHALRMGIGIILENDGLSNSNLTEIMIGDLTLFPLQSIYRSMISEVMLLNETELKIIDNIFKRLGQLGEMRNRILHAAWFIDYKCAEDIKCGLLTQYKPGYSKKGAKQSPVKFPVSEIRAQIEESEKLNDIIHELNMCLYSGTKMQKRFVFNEQNLVQCTGSITDYIEEIPGSKPGSCQTLRRIPLD
ncbi:MAG: hypothetical protein WC333_03580 [Dehalococcoidia bacterium]